MNSNRRWPRGRRRVRQYGQILPLTALSASVFIGFAALSLDTTHARESKLKNQYVADSASVSAAKVLAGEALSAPPSYSNAAPDPAMLRAEQVAYLEGIQTDGSRACISTGAQTDVVFYDVTPNVGCTAASAPPSGWNTKVEVKVPPSGTLPATCSPSYNCISVGVSRKMSTYFAGAIGFGNLTAAAVGVAAVGTSAVMPCRLCLLGSSGVALNQGTNSSVSVVGSIQINSSATPSIVTANGSTTKALGAGAAVLDVGTASCSGCTPAVTTGATAIADPYGGIPYPSVANVVGAESCSGTCTIGPGVYSSINSSGSATLTLTAGVYVVTGPITLDDNSTLIGSGVMIYVTCAGYAAPATLSPCAGGAPSATCAIDSNNNSHLNETPPTSGTYKGLGIFFDRGNNKALCFSNNSDSANPGTVYAADSTLYAKDNANMNSTGLFAVNKLDIADNASIISNPTNTAAPSWGAGGGTATPTIVA